jgi:glyoxylase-like metal-dependent hydrolase (beta-lactamase superfamily II)
LLAAQQLRAQGLPAVSLAGGMKAWSLAWNSAEVPLAGETRLMQIRRTGKGCLSYLVGTEGLAAVVDAALEPEIYLNLAREQGWRITAVLDTHIHADHLSRSRQLAEECGATLFLPAQDRVSYPFTALAENNVVNIGASRLAAYHTPGHTLESTCYLLDNQALLTGDTLFLTGVGRPDLEVGAGQAERQAHMLYHSLQTLLALPPETLILPGHTSTPVAFDGQALVATLAEVSQRVAFLTLSEAVFVEHILARIPPAPPNHHHIVELNEAGRLPAGDLTDLEAGANRCAVG